MMILNLTQHTATADQIAQGVQADSTATIKAAMTFNDMPDHALLVERATAIATEAKEMLNGEATGKAMIGGAPFFMATLEKALNAVGITPVYAFSVRESVEVNNTDGTVSKQMVFKHLGFVEPQA